MTLKLNQTLHSVCYIYAHVCFSHSLHLAAHHSLSLPVSQKETCWSLFSARKQKKRCVCSRAICESYQPWRAWQGQKTLQLGVCACKCVCWIITATDRSLSDQGLMTLVAVPEVTTHEYIWTIHYTVKHTPGCRPYSNYIWTHVLHKNTHTHWSRGDIPQMRRRGRRRSVDWEMCCTNTHTHIETNPHISLKRWMNILIMPPFFNSSCCISHNLFPITPQI